MAETYIKKPTMQESKSMEPWALFGVVQSRTNRFNKAIEYTKRWFDIGADDVEHESWWLSLTRSRLQVLCYAARKNRNAAAGVHLHTTRGWGLANVLAAYNREAHYKSTWME